MAQEGTLGSSIDRGPPPIPPHHTQPYIRNRTRRSRVDGGRPPPLPPRSTRPDFTTVIDLSSDESSSDEEPIQHPDGRDIHPTSIQASSTTIPPQVLSTTPPQASSTALPQHSTSQTLRATQALVTDPYSPSRKKWYAVFRGKRIGVFENWGYVSSITTGIPLNSQRSYRTKQAALNAYFSAKRQGAVQLLWEQGSDDSIVYGPIEDAIL